MKLSDFDYQLPKELIAQEPIKPRDHSRLLILDKKTGGINHDFFYNIINFLNKGDVLVFNNSKVFPARLIGKKKETGGNVEVFLHKRDNSSSSKMFSETWECLVGGKVKPGLKIIFDKKLECEIIKNNNDGTWIISFNKSKKDFMKIVEEIGKVPLPPYIKKEIKNQKSEIKNYQTVYADNKKIGSVAAPTAGFHFTPRLIEKLKKKGIQIEYVTLHVGLGTFAPVKTENIKNHKMHSEFVEIDKETIARLYLAKHEKRRIITVGTTSTRSLESLNLKFPFADFKFPEKLHFSISKYKKQFENFEESTDIFIFPGYKFKLVNAMLTNFHLPKSTLLMLISAFAGKDNINKAYKEAIKRKYRFYSYGDAMFIY